MGQWIKALNIESEDLGSSPSFSLYKRYALGNNGVNSLDSDCQNQINENIFCKVWSAMQILGIITIVLTLLERKYECYFVRDINVIGKVNLKFWFLEIYL